MRNTFHIELNVFASIGKYYVFKLNDFLAVQNSSLGDLVTDWLTHSLTNSTFTFKIQRATQEACDLWYIWSEWWGDHLTKKKDNHKDI